MMAKKPKSIAEMLSESTTVVGTRTVREGNWDVHYIILKPKSGKGKK